MKTSPLLNELLTKGAILGGIMLLANVTEMFLVNSGNLLLVVLAGLLSMSVWALFSYLAYRFTRSYAELVLTTNTNVPCFTYVNGLCYVVTLSMLAGVISVLGSYICLHQVIGYEEYVGAYIKLVNDVLNQSHLSVSMAGIYDQMIQTLQSQPEPTFVQSLYSGVMSFTIFGFFAGLIIAIFTRRKADNVKQNE